MAEIFTRDSLKAFQEVSLSFPQSFREPDKSLGDKFSKVEPPEGIIQIEESKREKVIPCSSVYPEERSTF